MRSAVTLALMIAETIAELGIDMKKNGPAEAEPVSGEEEQRQPEEKSPRCKRGIKPKLAPSVGH